MTVYASFYGQRARDNDAQKVDTTGIQIGNRQSTAAGSLAIANEGFYFVSCDAAHNVRFTNNSGDAANQGDYWPSGWAMLKYLPAGSYIVVG